MTTHIPGWDPGSPKKMNRYWDSWQNLNRIYRLDDGMYQLIPLLGESLW